MLELAQDFDPAVQDLSPLTNEASGRKYFRAQSNNKSFVVCWAPEGIDQSTFFRLSKALSDHRIKAPEILAFSENNNVSFQSDLGDKSLIYDLEFYKNEKTFQSVIEAIVTIQKAKIKDIPKITINRLREQAGLIKNVFFENFLDLDTPQYIEELIDVFSERLMNHPQANSHTDFERRNLFILPDETVAVIDFQDLCMTSIGTDLAGISIDHYSEINHPLIDKVTSNYLSFSKQDISFEDMQTIILEAGVHRNMRILGTLARLYTESSLTFRLKDLPQILNNLSEILLLLGHDNSIFKETRTNLQQRLEAS